MKLLENEQDRLVAEFTQQEFQDFMNIMKAAITDYGCIANTNSYEIEAHAVSRERIQELVSKFAALLKGGTYPVVVGFSRREFIEVLDIMAAAAEISPDIAGISNAKSNQICEMIYNLSRQSSKKFQNG